MHLNSFDIEDPEPELSLPAIRREVPDDGIVAWEKERRVDETRSAEREEDKAVIGDEDKVETKRYERMTL